MSRVGRFNPKGVKPVSKSSRFFRGFIALFTFLVLLLFDMQIIEKVRKCKNNRTSY